MSWPWKRRDHPTGAGADDEMAVKRLATILAESVLSTTKAVESNWAAAGQGSMTRRSRVTVFLETWWFYLYIVDRESFQSAGKETQACLFDRLAPLATELTRIVPEMSEVLMISAPGSDIGASAMIGERFWERYDQVALEYGSSPRALLGEDVLGGLARGESLVGHLCTRMAGALGEERNVVRGVPLNGMWLCMTVLHSVSPAHLARVSEAVRTACRELRQEPSTQAG